ncbi:MDR family MFS transporter [Streptomyces lavendulae]|uniref:MDR family MFS transporter n=1 Tax=Streptomyces lavendulae TaxID=1914 RepID=UPI0036B1BA59
MKTTAAALPVLDSRRRNLAFCTIMLAVLLASLDQTIVGTALPTIVADLGGTEHMSWVVTAYLLAAATATALLGKVGALVGRKLVFQVSAAFFFVIGSFLCGAADNMTMLIAWRALQGFGAGGLLVTSTQLIGDVIPLRDRGRYQGAIGAVFGLSTVAGPLLGGLFADQLGWRWTFYINVPLAVLVVVTAHYSVPSVPPVRSGDRRSIDYLGIGLMTVGTGAALLATSWSGGSYGWGSPITLGLYAAAVAVLALFCTVETRVPEPMLPTRLFRNQVFAVCSVLSFAVGFAMFGALTYLPMYLQFVDGVSATFSGIRTLPMVTGVLIASVYSGARVSRTGRYRVFPLVGSLVMALGLLLLSSTHRGGSTWLESLSMFVLGAGIGSCMQILTVAVQNSVDYPDLGVATFGVALFRTLGSAFGTAVFGAVFAGSLAPRLEEAVAEAARVPGADPATVAEASQAPPVLWQLPPEQAAPIVDAYAETLHLVFLCAVPIALVAFVAALFLKQVPLRDVIRSASTDMGEGFASPTTAVGSQSLLELAVGKILRDMTAAEGRRILGESGTRLDVAGAWAVIQVDLCTRLAGEASLELIAGPRVMPPEALEPLFDRMVDEGYVSGGYSSLSLTEAGRQETRVLSRAWGSWLRDRLGEEHGRPGEAELRAAVDAIIMQLLVEDLAVALPMPWTGSGGRG